jgi:hypothetical protein
MVFAIAALLFQINPAIQHLDVSAVVPAATTVVGSSTADQPKPNAAAAGKDDPKASSSNSMNASAPMSKTPDFQAFSNFRLPDARPIKQYRIVSVENTPSRRNWMILSIAQHGAAIFDAYSTRQAIQAGARENDPLMRPFANSPAIYAAIQAGPVVMDLVARHMQRSQSSFLRRTWWIPQAASTGLFIFSGAHNLHVANNAK